MAIAVASTSSYSADNVSSIVIPAPSGITTDDLLIMICGGGFSTGFTPPAGWTEEYTYTSTGGGAIPDTYAKVWSKVAVLADESATDYTVTTGTEMAIGGVMYRLTGNNALTPIIYEDNLLSGGITSSGSYSKTSVAVERPTTPNALIFFSFGTNFDSAGYFTSSGYNTTSTDTDATWTEVIDTNHPITASSTQRDSCLSSAYGVATGTSDITAFGFDYTAHSGPDMSAIFGFLQIATPQDETGTTTLLQVSPTVNEANAVASASGTATLLQVSPVSRSATGEGIAPTVWTPTTKS